MVPSEDLSDHIRQLEGQLLSPAVRRSPDDVARLLADEFVEFGSSGRQFTKAKALAELADETPVEQARIHDFHLTVLGPEVVLARYRLEAAALGPGSGPSLRSSVWVLRSGRWQVLFHQGTPTSGP